MSGQSAYRPLLPLSSDAPPRLSQAVVPKRKRTQVLSACASVFVPFSSDWLSSNLTNCSDCRKRKVKCDGARPTCHGCASSNTPCAYPLAEGISQREAQKRKLSSISAAHEKSQRVLELLRASHDDGADDILKQLQGSDDIEEAIQSIADASLLLPNNLGRYSQCFDELTDSSTTARDSLVSPSDEIMPVSCWTKISQDDKALTHLVNSFWIWDNTLSHLVDRDLLVSSLAFTDGNTTFSEYGQFCSPLLVNAILAVSSLHATRNASESNSADILTLSHQFANHAFELLESEQSMSSLTLLQAAAILWTFASNKGSHHGRSQCVSLQSLLKKTWSSVDLDGLGSRLIASSRENDGVHVKVCQAVSRMTWGFYCFFSKASTITSPEMLVPRPLVSTIFENLDSQGYSRVDPASHLERAPQSLEMFVAECALCEIAAQFVIESARHEMDGSHHTALYNKLLCWQLSFPDHLMTDNNFPSSVLLLQANYDFIALRVLSSYLRHANTDVLNGHNVASLQVGHASSMMTSLWTYRGIYQIRHEYWAAEYCFFVVQDLLPRLDSDTATFTVRDIIGKACCIINEMVIAGVSGRAQSMLTDIEKQARASRRTVPAYGRQSARGESRPMITIRGLRVFDGEEDRMLDSPVGTFTVKFRDKIHAVD
ncbi:hypothetical protein CORC01_06429 [Colletotrichum orchidophilum]|uniref:Zn(2)-C6 fungal-type domain-containing protein n=1 Tax=Colletotrichum orchidophilum TaxID=1209926 RepID=A0A1G4BAB3_9PEZI|nr:uncharacterized protein CORC01_06429 [Colletotrichum orchidophilum]OHE98232.1 hypothetical protein CORC01_06429 [Colletotrichum orchidophilum]